MQMVNGLKVANALALAAALLYTPVFAGEKKFSDLHLDTKLVIEIHEVKADLSTPLHLDLVMVPEGPYSQYKQIAKVKSLGTVCAGCPLPSAVVVEAREIHAALSQINWPGSHTLRVLFKRDHADDQFLSAGAIRELPTWAQRYHLQGIDPTPLHPQMASSHAELFIKMDCQDNCYNRPASIDFNPHHWNWQQYRR